MRVLRPNLPTSEEREEIKALRKEVYERAARARSSRLRRCFRG
jgi:hypothetical protein